MKFLRPADWPDLAVALLLEDVEDPEIAELAGFDASVSDWTVHPLTEALYEKHGVPELDPESAVECLAGLTAADLRARPSVVTGPMIRLLARLAPPDFDSSLANRCYGAEEYLDCGCAGRVDPTYEAELSAVLDPGCLTRSSRCSPHLSGPHCHWYSHLTHTERRSLMPLSARPAPP